MGLLDLPLNLTNWVLVGSSSPNLAVRLHIHLKFECSVVFGYLKADVDELPRNAINGQLAFCGKLTDTLARIYRSFVLPQLDKGILVDQTRMAYVPDDVYDLDPESFNTR